MHCMPTLALYLSKSSFLYKAENEVFLITFILCTMSKQTHDVPRLLSKRSVNLKRKYWGQKNRNSSYITVSSSDITVTVVKLLMAWKICNMLHTEVCSRAWKWKWRASWLQGHRNSPSLEFAFPRSSRRSPESFYNKTGGEIKFLMAYRVANRKISL